MWIHKKRAINVPELSVPLRPELMPTTDADQDAGVARRRTAQRPVCIEKVDTLPGYITVSAGTKVHLTRECVKGYPVTKIMMPRKSVKAFNFCKNCLKSTVPRYVEMDVVME